MARHYYNIELVVDTGLEEDDIYELELGIESSVRSNGAGLLRINTEYVDSEG